MANGYIDTKRQNEERKLRIIMGVAGLILLIYVCARCARYQVDNAGVGLPEALVTILMNFGTAPLAFSFGTEFWQAFGTLGILAAIVAWVAHDQKVLNHHYKDGEQSGTAAWQTPKTIQQFNRKFNAPYGKPIAEGAENLIYSKHCQLTMNTRKTNLNNNAMIIGGPGSGKSYNIVRPCLLQAYCSYVVTDPSGELLATTGKFFESQGYDIRVFNLTDMAHSHCYNPFCYLRGEEDVLTLINCLIKNTEGQKQGSGDPFWEKAETALLEAIIFYLIRYQKPEMQNFAMVSKLLRQAKADPKKAKSQLDEIFDEVRRYDDNDICIKQYDIFKQASEKTAQSILITAAVRLAPFNINTVENLTSSDDVDLRTIGDKKTITYIIVPQGNNPYAFLVNMLYSQMFDTLYYHAATDCEGLRLKHDVHFVLDEFANIGIIPDFQVKLTTMRKYGLACMIFIQAVGQIKNLYKDDWETLMGACDTLVYLGGNELSSMEDLSKKLGNQTIRVRDSSHSRSGKGGSDSKSFKWTKRELLTVDEIRRLKKGYCIIVIKGEQPFYDEKFVTPEHPNAKYLGDLGEGIGLYIFDYCNAKAEDLKKLEKRRKSQQDNVVKRGAASMRPEAKPYVAGSLIPSAKQMTKEEEKEMVKQLADRITDMSFDREAELKNGATIKSVRGGIVSVSSAKPKNRQASASGKVMKATVPTERTIPNEDMMNDFASAFSDADFS